MKIVLYNPLSGKGNSREVAEKFVSENSDARLVNMTDASEFEQLKGNISKDDDIYLFGGDGTLNKFVNAIDDSFENNVYYYPSGTGNDFCVDIGKKDLTEPELINDYIKNLPTVTVNGKQYKFINGVGYGIDGYCCEVGDKLKAQGKLPNYTTIAIKGLLFHFKPRRATVTVDGEEKVFEKVWIAPTMFGRHYGGGMMPTPDQNRCAEEKEVSLMVFHGSGKLKTLMIFPSIFKGQHVKKTKYVTVIKGKNISVEFDAPCALQIDGETILNVTGYSVTADSRVTVHS